MRLSRSAALKGGGLLLMFGSTATMARAAETLADLVRGAKSERELALIAGGLDYGEEPGIRALNLAFNKRFNLDTHISLTPGPSHQVMATRITTEYKGNRPASTAVARAALGTFITMVQDGVLERVDWVRIFPWVDRRMMISPAGEGLLIATGPDGILYNPKYLAAEKAPKRYEDLVDSRLNGPWVGKIAVPPYSDWLAELTLAWNVDRVMEFAKKLMAISGGELRYGDPQAIIDGRFVLMANEGSPLNIKWTWETQGVPLNVVFASKPANTNYIQLGVPKNCATPNLAKLFVGFMVSPEAQAITDRIGAESSHLVPGTRMYRFVRESSLALQDPSKLYAFYSAPSTPALYDQIGKIVRQ